MSSYGSGAVLFVPVVLAGGAALAALSAAGVGICVAGARGVMVCGGAVAELCHEHAARRQAMVGIHTAIRRARQSHQGPVTADKWQETLRNAQLEQAAGAERLARWRDRFATPAPSTNFIAPPPRENLLSAPPVTSPRIVDELDHGAQHDHLKALYEECERILGNYEGDGLWADLFPADRIRSLQQLLEEARTQLRGEQLADAQLSLRTLQGSLDLMQRSALDRWAARQRALNELVQADQALQRALEALAARPDLVNETEAMRQAYDLGRTRFEECDFAQAEAFAASARLQAETLATLPDAPRRHYLERSIEALERELEAHGQFSRARDVQGIVERARLRLRNGQLDRAEDLLNQAAAAADDVLKEVEVRAGAAARDRLAELSMEVLEEMGYAVEDVLPAGGQRLPTEERRLIGRKGEREFEVILMPDGTLWYDVTRGYKGRECDDIKDFLAGLEARGVVGLWEPVYSLEQMAAQFRAMLRQENYIFYEEPSPDGLVITARKGTQEQAALVRWNGKLEGAPGVARERQPAQNTIDTVRRRETQYRQRQKHMVRLIRT